MTIDALFNPLRLGEIEAPHRVFMAPLSRMRANPSGVPQVIAAKYYSQRAGAGLIIGEGTSIVLHGTTPPCEASAFSRRLGIDSFHEGRGSCSLGGKPAVC